MPISWQWKGATSEAQWSQTRSISSTKMDLEIHWHHSRCGLRWSCIKRTRTRRRSLRVSRSCWGLTWKTWRRRFWLMKVQWEGGKWWGGWCSQIIRIRIILLRWSEEINLLSMKISLMIGCWGIHRELLLAVLQPWWSTHQSKNHCFNKKAWIKASRIQIQGASLTKREALAPQTNPKRNIRLAYSTPNWRSTHKPLATMKPSSKCRTSAEAGKASVTASPWPPLLCSKTSRWSIQIWSRQTQSSSM